MKPTLLIAFFTLLSLFAHAGKISGTITDDKGNPLPYASVSIKGTTKGTTSNSSGKYLLELNAGQYTLIAQYVGYAKSEKTITVTGSDQYIDFRLSIQELTLGE